VKLFNTIKRKKEELIPIRDGEVWMYTCGPTVYGLAHIGNFRTFIFEDVLRRYLKLKGYRVRQVMNITDIDDKTIAGALKENVSIDQFTSGYIDAFFEDLETLGIEKAEYYPRATEHIEEMIGIINGLLEKKFAYEKNGSVYFDISKYGTYGKLSGRKASDEGGVVDSDEYGEDMRDFALWKAFKEGEPFWEAPFGKGRPGWHIECSAMSMKYLGKSFDIHTGGVDNIFPHHENEIAQSEAYTDEPFVRYWLHSEHLIVDGEKMSKSKGNYYTIRDLVDMGHDPKAIRFSLASSYYKHPLNFTLNGLEGIGSTLRRIGDFHRRIVEMDAGKSAGGIRELVERARDQFYAGMDDDLNCPRALGSIFEMVRQVNKHLDLGESIDEEERSGIIDLIDSADHVFEFLPEDEDVLPEKVAGMIEEREEARGKEDYAKADKLRDDIAREGFLLEDTPKGVKWRKSSGVKKDQALE
jgi:cysteinyl-tRNA synthetase